MGCFVVQSVTGQAGTVAAVDTAVSDAVSVPSSAGAGSLFDLTGLLDTVSANVELSGVPATDTPPAALAVAALTANPTLVAAAVSKPLDVSSLSSVDAGLASLLMLKQTVSNGLVASAEAKSPTSGPAADLANITLTLKFNNRAPEMAPLVQPVEATVVAPTVGSEALALPVDGTAQQPLAAGSVAPVPDEHAVAPAPDEHAVAAVDGVILQTAAVPVEGAPVATDPSVQPVNCDPQTVDPALTQPDGVDAIVPVEGLTEVTVVLPNGDQSVAVTPPDLLEPFPFADLASENTILVRQDNGSDGGFKFALVQTEQGQSLDPSAKLPGSDGLGVLNVKPDETGLASAQDQSVLRALADGTKSLAPVGHASAVTPATIQTSTELSAVSALAQAAGLKVSLASQPVNGQKAETSKSTGLSETGIVSTQITDDPVKAQDISTPLPIVGQPVITDAAMVQQQAVIAAQILVQPLSHQTGLGQTAPASQTRETGLASVSTPGTTRKPVGSPAALPRDGATVDNNVAALAHDQQNIQQIQQRDADTRDASDQQASSRQADHQLADRRNDEAQAVKAKAADVSTASGNGSSHSDQSPNQGSQGKSDQGQGLAHDLSGSVSTGGFVSEEAAGMTGVQAGGLVSGSLTSKAILTVQYALSGSSAGRTGPATAAEMRFQSLGQQVLTALRNNAQEIELTLNPSQLGQVILRLNVDGSKVRVSAKTESKMTDEALKAGEEDLKTSLLAQGFVLDGFDVSHDDDRRRAPKTESEGATVAQSTDGEAFSIDLIA